MQHVLQAKECYAFSIRIITFADGVKLLQMILLTDNNAEVKFSS